jgi:hypothetical protein
VRLVLYVQTWREEQTEHLRQSHRLVGLQKYWLGHAGTDMTDLHDRSSDDEQYRRDVATAMGVGFELPKTLSAKPAKPKTESLSDVNGLRAETAETVLSN